jgi:DNA-binding transcriptional LysR family regulator
MVKELEHFLLVVELGTLTAAAKRAHLSQPALTASIRRLEDDVGGRLLVRGRHGAELTKAGEALLPKAQAALALLDDGRRAVAEVEGLHRGEVVVGAGATACTYFLPRYVARFRKKRAGIKFMLREVFSSQIREAVAAGKLDLGIVTGPGDEAFVRDKLILVASPKLDQKSAGFVTFPPGSATRGYVEERFGDIDVVMELSSIAAVKTNVRAGIGMALLSTAAVEADLRTGRLVEVRSRKTPIVRTLSLVHRGVARLTPSAAAFRDLLLSY